MDVNDCFKKRVLKRIRIDKFKVENSLRIAETKFGKAKELFDKEFFDEALVSAYTSMFHSARALLYKDGIQEKSHFAVHVYLREKYSNKISKHLIEAFKVYQLKRHEFLYDIGEKVLEEDAENAILDAEDFLREVRKLL